MKKKAIGVVLLAAGSVLLYWGYNISQSLNSKLNEAIGGAPPDKAMIFMGLGGVCVVLGFFSLFKFR